MEKISVRNLVEFILRSGDIESSQGGFKDAEAMQKGIKIHKMIQNKKGPTYRAEVPMAIELNLIYNDCPVDIIVEGRADGIDENDSIVIINEIKSMYQDVTKLEKPYEMHRAQAMCYAAIYVIQNKIEEINIEMTYCQIETMFTNNFEEKFEADELKEWFNNLVMEYAKWVAWKIKWQEKRNDAIKKMEFPFEYRKGQFDLVKNVYLTILRKKKLFLQAPTGVGKTISTVFPAVTAMGEGIADKIFYLTAKTITRTVAEDTFSILNENNVPLKCVTITAKDKICIFEKSDCNPATCSRAKGHYDRVNDAVYDMLVNEEQISRELIEQYAEKHMVCPFEMCLDITTWCDVVICDYNYVFDPKVCLKRFFSDGGKEDYVYLIDEAHNLVDRARTMYTAVLDKDLVMDVRKSVKDIDNKLYKGLENVNKTLLSLKRECDDFAVFSSLGNLEFQLMRVVSLYEDFLKEVLPLRPQFANKDNLMQLYFDIKFFLEVSELINDKYRIYADYSESGEFRVTLRCMDPSDNLQEYLDKGRSTIYFSATLLPVKYYMEQLGGNEEDYAVYAESSFSSEKQLVLVATDVSTKYTRRTPEEYERIINYIFKFVNAKRGNYIVFFPSYKMMNDIYEMMLELCGDDSTQFVVQHNHMTEEEKEEFLQEFNADENVTKLGLCVMGGIFSEGIDLRDDKLIGAVIVGTGLPMVGDERELFRYYYDEKKSMGFEFAYLYPGMNKVLQSAGRVIRTATDKGAILLLDERFGTNQYRSLFPREWKNSKYTSQNKLEIQLREFWN